MATITPPTQAPLRLTDQERADLLGALAFAVQLDNPRLGALREKIKRSRPSRRDTIYRMLSDAGEQGVTAQDFRAHGIPLFRPHVESLSLEAGLAMSFETERANGGYQLRIRLVRDDWA